MAPQYAVGIRMDGQRLVFAVCQLLSDQFRDEKFAPGIEAPVFGDSHGRVNVALAAGVILPRSWRGNLQHEIGGLAFPPDQPGMSPVVAGGPENHVNVRSNPGGNVVHAVIHQHIAGYVDVGASRVAVAQGKRRVGHGNPLPVVVGHGFPVPGWVYDAQVLFLIRGGRMLGRRRNFRRRHQ